MKWPAAVSLGAVLVLAGTASVAFADGPFAPPDGMTLLLVGQNIESIRDYIAAEKTVPAGFMTYTSIQNVDGLDDPADNGTGTMHAQKLVDQYPDTVIQIGLYMVGALEAVNRGKYDRNIDLIGKWIAQARRPVYLRIGYEFDLPDNGYEPAAYVKAYRRIVDRLRRNGVKNAAFVWHSYAGMARYPLLDYYPGDEYVDWFGVSFFENVATRQLAEMAALSREKGKPLMVAESTPAKVGVGAGKQAVYRWYRPLFKFIERNDVKMLCYINTDWDDQPMFAGYQWGDSRVQRNDDVHAAWREETAKEWYLASGDDLYELLGFAK